jgi:penicillin-binding protein 1A
MAAAMLEPVVLRTHMGGSKTSAPAAVNLALNEVKHLGIEHSLISSGFAHPYMTIDPDIQDAVNRGVQAGKENFNMRWPGVEMPQMAVVVLRNSDAAILGMYGGHLEDDVHNYSSYNRATMSVRQPGSTFKGIDALAAVRNGVTPDSIFEDRPYCINMGRGRRIHCVSNYDGTFKGPISVREIIAQSRNVPTLRMVDSLQDGSRSGHRGIDEVIATARMLGISTEMHRYSVSALGSDGVIPLEFANAYRAIASGISAKPYVVSQVTDERGNILTEHDVLTEPLPVSPSDLRIVQELLRGTIRLPGATGRSLRNFPVPCAGKTGTSNEHRDAWFVCFTYGSGGITVLAWVGYDEYLRELPHAGRPKATGGSAALPIVRTVLEGVYGENKPLGEPPRFPRALEASIENYIYWKHTFKNIFQ